jgi:predicted ATP-grasp superfamily ATP-dependent carboligase
MNSSISQIKISMKSLAERVEKIEYRVLGTEDKVEQPDQKVKEQKKSKKT